jgi:2',3'-cyclic-nucleotide 2'-phosphodiesterase (5'-nucleotidase family)
MNPGEKGLFPESPPGWTDFSVITVGCVRIGFFGLVTKPVGENDQPYDGPYYREHPGLQTDFNFTGIAGDIIARHRQEVDVLVLISHLGLQDDILLAQETSGIDLILGGHTHSTTKTPLRVKNTMIVHTGAYGENIGRMDITVDIHKKRIAESRFHLIANRPGEVPDDDHTGQRVADILKPYERELCEAIADVNQNQKKDTMALIAARAAVETFNIDAAVVSEDLVWQEWNKGELTRQDILNAFRVERQPAASPGHSSLYLVEVKGRDLIHAIAVLKNSAYWGPSRINPKALYTIALQKLPALNQTEIFGKTIGYSQPKPAAELWEAVVSFAMGQKSAGLSLNQGLQGRDPVLVALLKSFDTH